jgi:hypothetical protein
MIFASALLVIRALLSPTKKRTLFSRLPLSEPTISVPPFFNIQHSLSYSPAVFHHVFHQLSYDLTTGKESTFAINYIYLRETNSSQFSIISWPVASSSTLFCSKEHHTYHAAHPFYSPRDSSSRPQWECVYAPHARLCTAVTCPFRAS